MQREGPSDRLDGLTRAGRKKEEADARRCLGRSRGGLTTKIDAAVDRRGRLQRLLLTAGQCGDAPQAQALLERFPKGKVGHVIADAAYDSDAIRHRAKQMKSRACIRPNPTRKAKKRYDRRRYRNRNVIERFFCGLKRCRRVATRYEKKAANFAGFVWLAALIVVELA